VDKNRNKSRQLFHLWGALILALPLSFTVPMQAQTTAPDNTMPPTAAPPTQVPPDTVPADNAPNPPERAEPVGPTRQPPTSVPRDRDITERDVAEMDHFLDHHPEIAEQLRRDPSLIDNQRFVVSHPELQEYLQMHPSVRKEFDQNPNAFMHAEERYDRSQEERGHYDYGITREELSSMDHFLDSHPEIAEQLRKDPSLIDNRRFVADHPELQEYLQSHPRVSAEFHEHPTVFMHDEERYDRREDDRRADAGGYYGHDRDFDRREVSSFGEFLRGHSTTADALSSNPSLATNREFLETHPDLREYLQAHPVVQQQLSANPQAVMTSPALAGTTAPPQRKGVTTAPPLKQPDQPMPIKPEPPMKPEVQQH
jgi:hypothetical protein